MSSEVASLEILRDYFEKTVKPAFTILEPVRKRIARSQRFTSFGVPVAVLTIALVITIMGLVSGDFGKWVNENLATIVVGSMLVIIVFGLLTLVASRSSRVPFEKYRAAYKEIVVLPVFQRLNTTWKYDPKGKISVDLVKDSLIFGPVVDIDCDDYVSGKIGKTDFVCCDLVTYGKGYDQENKEIKKESFRGFFVHADFNKKLNGTVLVKPAPKVLLDLGSPRVKMENVEFDKAYEVHTNMHQVMNAVAEGVSLSGLMEAARGMSSTENHIEARYVITPRMMEAILEIEKTIGYKPVISFTDSGVNFGFFTGRELFEADIKKPVSFENIEEIRILFTIVEVIVNEMDLNTRIWTKE